MSNDGRDLVEKFYRFMAAPPDADALADVRSRHQPYELHSIDQLAKVGDVVMWDAVVTTANGMLETTEVLVLDDAGKIERHIPGLRGYWGD